ncbi:glycosyltransferase family 4 protein [uncultured Algoriphagus sp.]|uniref:glycosyltransferase family 4 protein n=1 Tax=uncultured Algoriphagus sp. TaxID=417365 RepID=UPI0030EEA449
MSNKAVNVGVGIPCLLVGGTEIQTLNLVRSLILDDYHVNVICYFEYDPLMVIQFENLGATVTLLKWDRAIGTFSFIRSLAAKLREYNFDLFHVQYVAPGALPIVSARLAKIKKVLATVHQPKTASHGRFSGLILNVASFACTTFLSVSLSTEKSWFGDSHLFSLKKSYTEAPKHCTIYNSLDTEQIDFQLSQLQVASPSKKIRIGTVCRLNYVKGVDVLIHAFSLLRKESSEAMELLIYGEGEDENRLRNLVQELALTEDVQFLGKLPPLEVVTITSNLDIVVVPSRFEAFGLYAAEAMYVGKPVIASDSFGLAEVITHGETGLLFPVGNAQLLMENMLLLVQDSDLRMKLARAAKESIKSRFDFEDYHKSIGKLYSLMSNSS